MVSYSLQEVSSGTSSLNEAAYRSSWTGSWDGSSFDLGAAFGGGGFGLQA